MLISKILAGYPCNCGRSCQVERCFSPLLHTGEKRRHELPAPAHKAIQARVKVAGNHTGVERVDRHACILELTGQFIGCENHRQLGLTISLPWAIFFLTLQILKVDFAIGVGHRTDVDHASRRAGLECVEQQFSQ